MWNNDPKNTLYINIVMMAYLQMTILSDESFSYLPMVKKGHAHYY